MNLGFLDLFFVFLVGCCFSVEWKFFFDGVLGFGFMIGGLIVEFFLIGLLVVFIFFGFFGCFVCFVGFGFGFVEFFDMLSFMLWLGRGWLLLGGGE